MELQSLNPVNKKIMKNIVKQVLISSMFLTGLFSCTAQQIKPLHTAWADAPTSSYFKDSNNEFDPYVGVWVASYSGKTIVLSICKELQKPFTFFGKSFFRDILSVKFEVRDNIHNIIKSTFNSSFSFNGDHAINSVGKDPNSNDYLFVYNGGDCAIGMGVIYLKKISSNQMYWTYKPETATLNDITCPPPVNLNIYLPKINNLIFTKQ